MNRYLTLLLLPLFFTPSIAETINVHGVVTDKDSAPVSGAVVTLLSRNLKDTTETDGSYAIIKNDVAVVPSSLPDRESISFKKGILELDLISPSPVKIEIYTMKGSLLDKEVIRNASAGKYRLNMTKHTYAPELLIINASIGSQTMTIRYLPMDNGLSILNNNLSSSIPSNNRLAKITENIDSLEVTAEGYKRKVVIVDSYDSEINVTLDSETEETVCEGCGKTDYPESGKKTIEVTEAQTGGILVERPHGR